MCQLTLVDLKHPMFNKLYLWNQFRVNTTGLTNHDGFGLFNGTVNKSELDVQNVNNYGSYLNGIVTNKNPIIGHVRQATAVYGKKMVDRNSSHPFEDEKLVLAHNGMLDIKVYNKDYADVTVDSIIFLKELSSKYDGTNFYKALTDTMELFYGTFAFLIYSKLEQRYFVVRGNTKKLFQATITLTGKDVVEGLVVNTEKESLFAGLMSYQALIELCSPGIKVTYTPVVELKAETVFELVDSKLVELGVIKENTRPAVVVQQHTATCANFLEKDDYDYSYKGANVPINVRYRSKLAKDLALEMTKLGLTIYEIDAICDSIYGKGLPYCTTEQLKELTDVILKKLWGFYTKSKRDLWDEIVFEIGDAISPANDYNLHFPYMLNSTKQLKDVSRQIKKELKQ